MNAHVLINGYYRNLRENIQTTGADKLFLAEKPLVLGKNAASLAENSGELANTRRILPDTGRILPNTEGLLAENEGKSAKKPWILGRTARILAGKGRF